MLATSETIHVDGTFEICPRLLYQVFTINTFVHGQQFPLVYGLLPGKSREVYNQFFMAVKEEALKSGVHFSPDEIMTDFGLAVVQALELPFPGARIHRCYCHFSQCLWRKVQRLGLVEEYKEDSTIRRFIQRSAAIAFVQLNFVQVSWNGLKAEMPDNEKLERYAAYVDETWFDGHCRPRMWNYYRHYTVAQGRTTIWMGGTTA